MANAKRTRTNNDIKSASHMLLGLVGLAWRACGYQDRRTWTAPCGARSTARCSRSTASGGDSGRSCSRGGGCWGCWSAAVPAAWRPRARGSGGGLGSDHQWQITRATSWHARPECQVVQSRSKTAGGRAPLAAGARVDDDAELGPKVRQRETNTLHNDVVPSIMTPQPKKHTYTRHHDEAHTAATKERWCPRRIIPKCVHSFIHSDLPSFLERLQQGRVEGTQVELVRSLSSRGKSLKCNTTFRRQPMPRQANDIHHCQEVCGRECGCLPVRRRLSNQPTNQATNQPMSDVRHSTPLEFRRREPTYVRHTHTYTQTHRHTHRHHAAVV